MDMQRPGTRGDTSTKEIPMPAKNGDTVLVHYTGTLADGTVFDSSRDGDPLESVLGQQMLIPGFENALLGMKEGDRKTVTIPPEDAYGEHLEELVLTLPHSEVPAHMKPETGMLVQLALDDDQEFEATVTDVTDENIVLDANHPLAGESLTFDLELVAIKK